MNKRRIGMAVVVLVAVVLAVFVIIKLVPLYHSKPPVRKSYESKGPLPVQLRPKRPCAQTRS